MVFSDTTNKNGLIQRCERLCNLSDGAISGDSTLLAYFTSDINEVLYELIVHIMQSQDTFDWDDPYRTDFPIATTPLVADQRDYQFDNLSFLRLKRVDIAYDGSTYYRATPLDSSVLKDGLGNDTTVDGRYSKTEPRYDPKSFGFWLYPRANATDVTNGGKIRIEFSRAFEEFETADTDTEPPIDRPFHELIAIGASLKWSTAKQKRNITHLTNLYTEGIDRMIEHYANRNEDQDLFVTIDNQNYG